jgi:PAS domain S-box-containing protein
MERLSSAMNRTDTIDPTAEHRSRLLALCPELLAAVDPDGRLELVNGSWADALGTDEQDLLGRPFLELVHPDDAGKARAALGQMRDGETVAGRIWRLRCNDGGERAVLWRGRCAAFDGINRTLYLAGQDVTQQRDLEAELNRRAENLERVNTELQEFAYIASHDLAEPLRMVTSYLELLERRYGDALDDTAHEFIGFAVGGAVRMRALIDDLLTYSRVGSHELCTSAVDLAEVLGNVLLSLKPAIDEAGATVQAPGTLATVAGDPVQIAQLLQNLIANAVKFRAPGRSPLVTVSAEEDGDGVRITVADNGIGIDPAHHDRIFKMFARLHGRDEYEGTGIGLAVCRRIAERNGGRIWVRPAGGEGSGSAFHVWLPGHP